MLSSGSLKMEFGYVLFTQTLCTGMKKTLYALLSFILRKNYIKPCSLIFRLIIYDSLNIPQHINRMHTPDASG